MTRDDIIRMARDSGMELYGLGKDREKFIHYLNEFAALVAAAEREKIIAEGWRQCAVGQRTTQFCLQLQNAVEVERESIVGLLDRLVDEYESKDRQGSADDIRKIILHINKRA